LCGIQGGQLIDESDDKATGPLNNGLTSDDAAASLYYALGVNQEKEYHTTTGRPITVVRNGQPITQLFSYENSVGQVRTGFPQIK